MINLDKDNDERIRQGDILKDIEYIESYNEDKGIVEISKIIFPYVIVVTQDCDLQQDHNERIAPKNPEKQDKYLISIIVIPLYNHIHCKNGEHLSDLSLKMEKYNTDRWKIIKQNNNPRYHYLELEGQLGLVDLVADFKHYFTINVRQTESEYNKHFVGKLPSLYRELISQRFSNYLSRIGLPEPGVHE